MKKIDWTIWIGLITGFSAIAAAITFEDLGISFLWNASAALVVGGGTLGAVLVKRGTRGVMSAFSAVFALCFQESGEEEHRVKLARLAWLAQAARKKGLRTFEGLANQVDDALIANGFILLAENSSRELMTATLSSRIEWEYEEGLRDVKTLEAAGAFAPTFGILGAVIGLASVLRFVGDPSALASGIASAFVATIYGIASANLLFFPLASRIRDRLDRNTARREEIATVMVALLDRATPRAIINQFNLMK